MAGVLVPGGPRRLLGPSEVHPGFVLGCGLHPDVEADLEAMLGKWPGRIVCRRDVRHLIGNALAVMQPDDPMGCDILAGLLGSGRISGHEVAVPLGPEVESLLRGWGIPFRRGGTEAYVDLFFAALCIPRMSPSVACIWEGVVRKVCRHKEKGRLSSSEVLACGIWENALGGKMEGRLRHWPMFAGALPFAPDRGSVYDRLDEGTRKGVHLAFVRMGMPSVSGRLGSLAEGWFIRECGKRGISG